MNPGGGSGMDLLSRIAGWLGENEATISAVVGITVLAGALFAGLRALVRRRSEASAAKAPWPLGCARTAHSWNSIFDQ